jgi:hypothetical protein
VTEPTTLLDAPSRTKPQVRHRLNPQDRLLELPGRPTGAYPGEHPTSRLDIGHEGLGRDIGHEGLGRSGREQDEESSPSWFEVRDHLLPELASLRLWEESSPSPTCREAVDRALRAFEPLVASGWTFTSLTFESWNPDPTLRPSEVLGFAQETLPGRDLL